MLNLKTNRIMKSKDILWLHKSYGQYMRENNNVLPADTFPEAAPIPVSTTEPTFPTPPSLSCPHSLLQGLVLHQNKGPLSRQLVPFDLEVPYEAKLFKNASQVGFVRVLRIVPD